MEIGEMLGPKGEFIVTALTVFIMGFFAMQAFLYGLFQICPDCFVHVGDDIYCVTLVNGSMTYDLNPRHCESGMWADSISNRTFNPSDEPWKKPLN